MKTLGATGPDGLALIQILDDFDNLLEERPVQPELQTPAARMLIAARGAVADWQALRDLHDVLTAGGQAYWNTVAPDAGLPATSGAYTTAMSFLTTRRDKAMSRALAALNRWRLA